MTVDDGSRSARRGTSPIGGGCWNANTDVHFFNMNKEEIKHERYDDVLHMTQSSENTQEGPARKSNGASGRRWQQISRVLVSGHHSR